MQPKLKMQDAINIVAKKYLAGGWNVLSTPRGTINNLMANKGSRVHFIQIILPGHENDARYQGLAKNTFIQNAMSNGAQPIHAKLKLSGNTYSISFMNINIEGRCLISGSQQSQTKINKTK